MENYLKLAGAVVVAVLLSAVFIKPVQQVIKQVVPNVGALSSPDISSPYISWGGVRQYAGSMSLNQATTTLCAIQSPAATSSLAYASFRMTLATTTASVLTFARATTAFATTTIIGNQITIASGAQATVIASTTAATIDNNGASIFPPSTYLVVGLQGGQGASQTFSQTGSCQVVWVQS